MYLSFASIFSFTAVHLGFGERKKFIFISHIAAKPNCLIHIKKNHLLKALSPFDMTHELLLLELLAPCMYLLSLPSLLWLHSYWMFTVSFPCLSYEICSICSSLHVDGHGLINLPILNGITGCIAVDLLNTCKTAAPTLHRLLIGRFDMSFSKMNYQMLHCICLLIWHA